MALGPFARILAQLVVPVVAILARALPAAYAQALQNARKAGVDKEAAVSLRKKISKSEALQILNLSEAEATPEAIQKVSCGTACHQPYCSLFFLLVVSHLTRHTYFTTTAIRSIHGSKRCKEGR